MAAVYEFVAPKCKCQAAPREPDSELQMLNYRAELQVRELQVPGTSNEEVFLLPQQRQSCVGPTQHMTARSGRAKASSAVHDTSISNSHIPESRAHGSVIHSITPPSVL